MSDSIQFLLYIVSGQNFLNGSFHIQTICIMASIAFICHGLHLAFDEILIIIQISVISSHTEIMAHIFRTQPFSARYSSLKSASFAAATVSA